jgi:tetratricopeptide (TPR) repeat protein
MALFGSTSAPSSRLEELKKILQRDPTSRQFLALAEEYRKQGKVRDAIVTLERGLSIHASSVAAHVSLGKAYQQIERWEEAIRSYQNALRYDRDNLVAIRQLAEVHLSRGDKLEALKKLKLYQGLKSGEKDVQEAIERLEEELEPGQVRSYPTSGIRSRRTERPAAAAPAAATSPVPQEAFPAEGAGPPESTAPFDVPSAPLWTQELDVFSLEAPALSARVPSTPEDPPFVETEPSFPEPEPFVPLHAHPEPPPAPREEIPPGARVRDVRDGLPRREVGAPSAALEVPGPETRLSAPDFAAIELALSSAASTAVPPSALPLVPPAPAAGSPSVEAAVFEVPVHETVSPEFPRADSREEIAAPTDTGAASESPTAPLVTETLAELYRSQGYLAEARKVYSSLAASAEDSRAARVFAEKAEALRASGRHAAVRKRLEGLLAPIEPVPPLANEDLSALLRGLVAEVPGLRSAALTDREGLAVLTEGLREEGEMLEVLLAELTSFVKSVGRSGAEIGAGPLRSLALVGERRAAVLANVNAEYALVLESDPEAALGEVRWAAARAAERLRPAVG